MRLYYSFNKSKTKKRVIKRFVEKIGLVYFGNVSQTKDEHQTVKGFTASLTHHDNHYSIGSSAEYDIRLVDRKDVNIIPDGTVISQNWIIMSFDLHTKQDVPHLFIMANNHQNKPFLPFFETFTTMSNIEFGTFEQYPSEFLEKYTIFSRQSMSIKIQKLFPADTALIFANHFWPLSVEQNEHVLYLYSTDVKVTDNLLSAMYENGLWLAGQIDYIAEQI